MASPELRVECILMADRPPRIPVWGSESERAVKSSEWAPEEAGVSRGLVSPAPAFLKGVRAACAYPAEL